MPICPEPLAVVAPVIAQTNVLTPQLSVGVTVGIFTILVQAAEPVAVIFAGQLMLGRILSVTMTLKEQVLALLQLSVTVQVTVVVPLLNTIPARELLPLPVVEPSFGDR